MVVADPSALVVAGLRETLTATGYRFEFYPVSSLSEIPHLLKKYTIDLVILNPVLVFNIEKQFQSIKADYSSLRWIALKYNWVDENLLSNFDAQISLFDTQSVIFSVVRNCLDQNKVEEETEKQPLSDRETEVLRWMIMGLSNKEVADKLSISTHTVISHRKNISLKTGIKSLSGLTIFAVVKGLVDLNSLPD
jgi:DNA-binding NarL/FixJ family response regulator